MLGELSPGQIDRLLHAETVGRLGCHAGDRTYVVPVTYVHDSSAIYGLTSEGMKVRMMRENPEVCFEVDRMENMANWRSVSHRLQDRDSRQDGPVREALIHGRG